MNPGLTIAVICTISGLLMLDKYSIGEFGISQPLVASALIGFAAGDFHSGVILGLLLQPVWLIELPIGRRIPLDAQAAGISGAVTFFSLRVLSNTGFEVAAIAAILVAAGASLWGGLLDHLARRINGVLARKMETVRYRRHLVFIHVAALEVAFIRGVVLALAAFGLSLVAIPVIRYIPFVPLDRLLAATVSIGLAGGLFLLGFKKQVIPWLVGFAAWIVVWVLVRF